MKNTCFVVCLCFSILGFSQYETTYEKPPVFSQCETVDIEDLKICFSHEVNALVFQEFKMPNIVSEENYKGNVVVLFEVTKQGVFKVIYVDAIYAELKEETKRVFTMFPEVKPATYNGKPIFKQYSYRINIPLDTITEYQLLNEINTEESLTVIEKVAKQEYDSVNASLRPYTNKAYKSQVNIPFSHQYYSKFDRQINLVGTNSHTASKPYIYNDVSKYYDFELENKKLTTKGKSWWHRKLFNEHLVRVESKKYWFTIDPILDLQVGKDTDADFNSTFNNTRGVYVQGGIGSKFSFSTSLYESQGRFAQYINIYAELLRGPLAAEPAIVPGRGIAKRFKTDAYDYPVAEAYLSYSPVAFFNIQFGHGKNFIGDGYRSLLHSDVASPSTFLKLNTSFWKIKYTNTWMWLRDVRPEVTEDGSFLTKYMANHYLSWNVSKRLNLGFFESVLWTDTNNRGFDINYLNPIIFYRALEFESGQDAGNAIIGLSGKYKWSDRFNIYSQFIIDEFAVDDIFGGDKSWRNKLGYQIGVKYYNAFNVDNLYLQAEYNKVRPYTYSHNTIVLNYGHNNQSMAHLWGSNFSEFIAIARYHYKRWFADAKFVLGVKGFDFNTDEDSFNYGGNIYRTENDRVGDTNITVGQGNKTNIFNAELQAGYLVNPKTNLKLFAYLNYRDFNPEAQTINTFNNSTLWISLGLRTDLFNWYFDF